MLSQQQLASLQASKVLVRATQGTRCETSWGQMPLDMHTYADAAGVWGTREAKPEVERLLRMQGTASVIQFIHMGQSDSWMVVPGRHVSVVMAMVSPTV